MQWHCLCCGAFMNDDRQDILINSRSSNQIKCPRGCSTLTIAASAGYAWNIGDIGGETIMFCHSASSKQQKYESLARIALDYRRRNNLTFRLETEEEQFTRQLVDEGWA